MIDPRNLDTLLHPQFDPAALKAATPVGTALPASPGAACGKIVFTADDAKDWAARGEKVVLVRLETSPEDIEGMVASQGILTVRGGMTSHAAVVARGMGTCCVSGCGNDNDVKIDEEAKTFELNGHKSSRATGSPSTAPLATSTASRSLPSPPPATRTLTASWAGQTLLVSCWS